MVSLMTRRPALSPSDQIDLIQRRRTRESARYSEQPVPIDIRRLPGTGEGGTYLPRPDRSWLSPVIGWMDPGSSWLT